MTEDAGPGRARGRGKERGKSKSICTSEYLGRGRSEVRGRGPGPECLGVSEHLGRGRSEVRDRGLGPECLGVSERSGRGRREVRDRGPGTECLGGSLIHPQGARHAWGWMGKSRIHGTEFPGHGFEGEILLRVGDVLHHCASAGSGEGHHRLGRQLLGRGIEPGEGGLERRGVTARVSDGGRHQGFGLQEREMWSAPTNLTPRSR